jgi:SAM-dependent methyltransferase
VFKAHVPEGCSVLEVGCGSGGFLYHLQDQYECYGNEWNPEDAAYVRDVGEIPCDEGLLEDIYPRKTFGAIIARQVLEHVPNPVEWIISLKNKLIGGGWMYLEVPHANDSLLTVYDIPEFKRFWYREPHITYWSADVLASVMSAAKMEARTSYFQRYGLENHMHWRLNGCPMDDPIRAQNPTLMKPVPSGHPDAPILNREWASIDRQYRLALEANLCTDSLRVIGRRREI